MKNTGIALKPLTDRPLSIRSFPKTKKAQYFDFKPSKIFEPNNGTKTRQFGKINEKKRGAIQQKNIPSKSILKKMNFLPRLAYARVRPSIFKC